MTKVTIEFDSEDQVAFVLNVMEMWLEGYEDATSDVERDPTIEAPEDMLKLLDGMHDQFNQSAIIVGKLRESIRERHNV